MAANRQRVTVVNPWVPGGAGQFRDLFPLPPALFLTLKFLRFLFITHYLFTFFLLIPAFILWIYYDYSWWISFILFPISLLASRLIVTAFYLWYRNPSVPIFARKPN